MNYLYNRKFKIGVLVGVLVFLVANVISYLVALQTYEELRHGPIQFSPAPRIRWGFPFVWYGYNFGYTVDGILNVIIAAMFGIIFGLIFRFWLKSE